MLESWNMSTCNSTFGSCSILCESTASIPERILVNLRVTIALLFVSITAQVVTKDPPGVFFGWVCAARDSKLAPRSIKNFPSTWYPGLEMGQFFILRSRLQQEYNSVLVNALNRIFKSNLSLNNFKWLLTKLELSHVRNIILRSRKRLWNEVMYGSIPPPPGKGHCGVLHVYEVIFVC